MDPTITHRSCVVSSAFSHVGTDSLTDKLARLNELLLYKTLSVEERRHGFYIPLSRDWWLREFGNDYTAVQEVAIKEGLIEALRNGEGNKSYCSDAKKAPNAGKTFPCSFRLADPYRTGSFKIWELSRKPRLKTHSGNLSEAGKILASKLPSLAVDARFAKTAWDAIGAAFMNRGFHRPHECEFNRFHTVLTGIESDLRKTLHMVEQGQNKVTHMEYETTEATETGSSPSLSLSLSMGSKFSFQDVANCQPLCLGIECRKQVGNHNRDINSWLELGEEGGTYEEIQSWLQKGHARPYQIQWHGRTITIDPSRWSRERVKKQFMVAVFGDDYGAPVWRAIEALWPTVAAIAAKIKSQRYQELAHVCQRLESSIMIQEAAMQLHKWIPDVPFGTIHDCIAISLAYSTQAKDAIYLAFEKHGVRPTITSQ